MSTFVIGPIQEKWIKSLEDNSEQHITGKLGNTSENHYRYCCLGKALMLLKEDNLIDYDITDGHDDAILCGSSSEDLEYEKTYSKLGLYDGIGTTKQEYLPSFIKGIAIFSSLVSINDTNYLVVAKNQELTKLVSETYQGYPKNKQTNWLVIAKLLRTYPEAWFEKSV